MPERRKTSPAPSAQILRFARPAASRRGRPKLPPRDIDLGTPELIRKRQLGQTSESIDLCLERQLITQQQHWCGIHLRWLYTLRNGSPSLRALDPNQSSTLPPRSDEADWRLAREQEYRDAIHALSLSGNIALIVNICVYNERPNFLTPPARLSAVTGEQHAQTLSRLRSGLDILVDLWRKP